MPELLVRALASVSSCAVVGLDGALVDAEVDISNAAPMFGIGSHS